MISRLESDIARNALDATDTSEAAQARIAANEMLSNLKNLDSPGRLVIDLDKIVNGELNSEIFLKDGDELFIPDRPYSVSVMGKYSFPLLTFLKRT